MPAQIHRCGDLFETGWTRICQIPRQLDTLIVGSRCLQNTIANCRLISIMNLLFSTNNCCWGTVVELRWSLVTFGSGVAAARQIAQLPTFEESPAGDDWPGCEIVFITAYDQYAVEAFEQGVVDYVLKPAERDRLKLTVERIRQRMAARQAGAASTDGEAGGPPLPTHTPAMQQLLQNLAAQLSPGTAGQAGMDSGQRRAEHPDDSGRRGACFSSPTKNTRGSRRPASRP